MFKTNSYLDIELENVFVVDTLFCLIGSCNRWVLKD